MRAITRAFVHCSESPDGRTDTVEDIRRWHTSPSPHDPSKPWSDIGYHWVIERTGPPRPGRPMAIPGAHVGGHNHDSVGICLIGTEEFTESQLHYLEGLMIALEAEYPGIEFYGHRDADPGKTCPNFDVRTFRDERRANRID